MDNPIDENLSKPFYTHDRINTLSEFVFIKMFSRLAFQPRPLHKYNNGNFKPESLNFAYVFLLFFSVDFTKREEKGEQEVTYGSRIWADQA